MDPRLVEAIEGLRDAVERNARAQEALAANLAAFVGLAEEMLVAADLRKENEPWSND